MVLSHARYQTLKRVIFDVEARVTPKEWMEMGRKVQCRLSALEVQLELNMLR